MQKTAKPLAHRPWARRFTSFLGTPLFFWLTILLFVLQAGWIALSARYPQAFDEQFHFGIIQLYSHHVSPFLNSQPISADQFGAVYRDPSYLYQYLLSFPYRLLTHLTQSLTTQIIVLRLINIAFFVSGLVLFRKVLRHAKASDALIHVVLAFIVLTPVIPLLASQINYDNLVFPLTALSLLLALRVKHKLRDEQAIPVTALCWFLIVGALSSIVKYAFLPLFAALLGVIVYEYFHARWKRKVPLGFKRWIRQPKHIILIIALLVSVGLFWQRFGMNTIQYHTPIPECNQVLSVQRCQAYGPWARNYQYEQMHIHLAPHNVVTYPFVWLYHSMGELVFTISSNFDQSGVIHYHVGSQLILIEIISWSTFGLGLLFVLRYAKWLWGQPLLGVFVICILVYVAALGGQNMLDYLHIGIPVAIHGRYLVPVLPLIYLILALVFKRALDAWHMRGHDALTRKAALTGVMGVLLLFEGGGFVTYILRSDPSWFWPQSSRVQKANSQAQKLLKPIVLDTQKKQ